MNQAQDRARRRRDYLMGMLAAKSQKAAGILVIVAFGSPALAFFGCLILCVIAVLAGSSFETIYSAAIIAVAGVLFFVYVTVLGFWIFLIGEEKEQSITYVPPVHEQIRDLPAAAVLLRGSDCLVDAHQSLLRPAVREQAPEEDLLRPVTGKSV